jgi:hypothetical protein
MARPSRQLICLSPPACIDPGCYKVWQILHRDIDPVTALVSRRRSVGLELPGWMSHDAYSYTYPEQEVQSISAFVFC